MSLQSKDDRVGITNFLADRVFSEEEKLQINQFIDLEADFISCLERLAKQKGGMTRCLATARTQMQQARMWAVEEVVGQASS
jgi:hypothetical protein